MPGVTDTQSLRFGYVTDVITHTMQQNLADDIATQLDAADTARAAALKRPVAKVSRIAALGFPVAPTITTVTWDSEVFDTHAMVDLGTQPTRVTAGATAGTGVYIAQAMLQGDYTSWTRADMIFYRNGVFYCQKTYYQPQSFGSLSITGMINLPTLGDYISLALYHEGGGTTNSVNLYMTVFKVST